MQFAQVKAKESVFAITLHKGGGGGGGRYFRDFLAIVEKGTYLEGVLTFEGALTFETVRYD